jgi:hypothetical protein
MNNSTNESTKDSNTDLNFIPEKTNYILDEIIGGVVSHPNGNCYVLIKKDFSNLLMSLIEGEQVTPVPAAMVLEAINSGIWKFFAVEDESWRPIVYTEEVIAFKNNALKSIIYNQLCIEANDALIGTVEHDPYLKNLLLKSTKGLQRKTKKYLEKMYGVNQEMSFNVFNTIDEFVEILSKRLPHEFFYLNSIVDEYNEDPSKYIGRKVKINKLQE